MSRLPSLNQLTKQVFRPALQLGNASALHRPVVVQQANSPAVSLINVRNATKKAAGSKTSNKDSRGRRLGSKKTDGEDVKVGDIIYRQRGTKIYPGENVGIGKDHTLFALEPGYVRFYYDPFHPKRKFAGVTFDRKHRLPTPHFEPTRRRFGRVEIEDPRLAEKEQNNMNRKEYLASPKILQIKSERQEKREKLFSELSEKLESFLPGLEEEEKKAAVARLQCIRVHLSGGRTVEEARKLADREFKIDTEIEVRANRLTADESVTLLATYTERAAKLDAAVSFDPKLQLIKSYTAEELSKMATENLAAMKAIYSQVTGGVRGETKKQLKALIDAPCFSLSTRDSLKKRFVKAMKPEHESKPLVDSNGKPLKNKEILALAKKEKGTVVKRWNYDERKIDLVYFPKL